MRTRTLAWMLLLAVISMGGQCSTVCAQSDQLPAKSESASRAQQRRDEREILQGVIAHLLTSDRLESTRRAYADGDLKLALLSSKSPVPWPFDKPPQVEGWKSRAEKGSDAAGERAIRLDIQACEMWSSEPATWRIAINISQAVNSIDKPANLRNLISPSKVPEPAQLQPTNSYNEPLPVRLFPTTVYYEAQRRPGQWNIEFIGGGQTSHRSSEEWVGEWRRILGFHSLRHRLAYETDRARSAESKAVRPEKLDPEARADGYGIMIRRSLRKLHYDTTEEFVKRDEFGRRRLHPAGPIYISMRLSVSDEQNAPIPFSTTSSDARVGQSEPPLILAQLDARTGSNTLRAPSRQALQEFNRDGQELFLKNIGLAYVESVDRVSGFDPHRMPLAPRFAYDQQQFEGRGGGRPWQYPIHLYDHWLVTRLELVSLLKNPEPAVYVSEHLPAMQELNRAETRELNSFEKKSLAQLYSGEETAAEGTLNHIQLLGAIRARNACLNCHSVEMGELLGAFTYDLQRDPLMAVEQIPVAKEPPRQPAPSTAGP